MNIKLKFCGCKWCRRFGMHVSNSKKYTRRISRTARHKWNYLTREERDDEITDVSVPPTY